MKLKPIISVTLTALLVVSAAEAQQRKQRSNGSDQAIAAARGQVQKSGHPRGTDRDQSRSSRVLEL